VEVLRRLDPDELAAVAVLVERATEADGVRPLSEHVSLHLRHGGDAADRHVLVYAGDDVAARPPGSSASVGMVVGRDRLAGYGHLDVSDQVAGSSAELVVDPELRGQGFGHRLAVQLLAETPDGRLRLWSHGGKAAAAALARSMGFTVSRSLWQMRRSLYAPLPEPMLPPGVQVRSFRPGEDDEAWLKVNQRAFAAHPEQGQWTAEDLRRRIDEPWFDPEGFFLAVRPGPPEQLAGFHWTKVHGAPHDGHGHEPIGEVYVVGVDPAEQGTGLGRALTLIGLRHLRAAGLPGAMLYVDEDNVPAIRLYTDLGFTHWDTDVMFTAPAPPG
jgi:mycothiol synthase